MTAEDAKKLLENTDVKAIKFYRGGKTYYWSKPIKHFGDYYTPIVEDNNIVPSVSTSYEYDNEKHLGRYGVVRNNWYEINIASVASKSFVTFSSIEVHYNTCAALLYHYRFSINHLRPSPHAAQYQQGRQN